MNWSIGIARRITRFMVRAEEKRRRDLGGPVGGRKSKKKDRRKTQKLARWRNRG